jgi:hypothetical protein
MKPLAEKFVKKGFKHQLYKREGKVAIYKRYQLESINTLHYEVIIINSHNGIHIEGNYIEPCELYPSGSQWGTFGWTFTRKELDKAETKFTELKKQLIESENKKQKKKQKSS